MTASQRARIKRKVERDWNFYLYKREALADIEQTFEEEEEQQEFENLVAFHSNYVHSRGSNLCYIDCNKGHARMQEVGRPLPDRVVFEFE